MIVLLLSFAKYIERRKKKIKDAKKEKKIIMLLVRWLVGGK